METTSTAIGPEQLQTCVAHRAVAVFPTVQQHQYYERSPCIHKLRGEKKNRYLLYYKSSNSSPSHGYGKNTPHAASITAVHYFMIEEPSGQFRCERVPPASIYAKPALLYIDDNRAIFRMRDCKMALVDAEGWVLTTFKYFYEHGYPLAVDIKSNTLFVTSRSWCHLRCCDMRSGHAIFKEEDFAAWRVLAVAVPEPQDAGSYGVDVYILQRNPGRGPNLLLDMHVKDPSDGRFRIIKTVHIPDIHVGFWGVLAVSSGSVFVSTNCCGKINVLRHEGDDIRESFLDIPQQASSMAVTNAGRLLFTIANTVYATQPLTLAASI